MKKTIWKRWQRDPEPPLGWWGVVYSLIAVAAILGAIVAIEHLQVGLHWH